MEPEETTEETFGCMRTERVIKWSSSVLAKWWRWWWWWSIKTFKINVYL